MQRTYVEVNLSIDETGYMKPMSVVWNNRSYPIQSVRSFRPAKWKDTNCYTILINGTEKHLFFEKTDPHFSSVIGRWFFTSNLPI